MTTLDARSRVWAVAFSPDSGTLATANEDGTVGLWGRGAAGLEKLPGHSNTVWSIAFSQDGKWLVSASEDGTVRFWPASIDEVRSLACQKAGRNLTESEWQEMFGTLSYQTTCPQFTESY
jgi:WD40 repeat protein